MSETSNDTFKEFHCVEDGLTYSVRVYQLQDGTFEAKIEVLEGSADFNAIYLGDGVDDGSSVNLKGSLNMSGNGSVDQDGNAVDWDDAIVLSKPGLGSEGADKDTYLSAGESFTFPVDISSLDEIQDLGVRATSTSTPEGSIKSVLEPTEEDEPDDDVEIYKTAPMSDPSDPVVESDEDIPEDAPVVESDDAAVDPVQTAIPMEELSDEAYFETFVAMFGSIDDTEVPEDEPELEDDVASNFM